MQDRVNRRFAVPLRLCACTIMFLGAGMPVHADMQEPNSRAAEVQAVVAEPDRARWEPRLRALMLGLRDGDPGQYQASVAALFPHMDRLRDKLLAAMGGPSWQEKGEQGRSAAQETRAMLALWADPRDAAVARQAFEEDKWMQPAPVRLAGATLDAALEAWRDYHFKREGIPDPAKRTANWLNVLAKTDCCAFVQHHVRYARWGYSSLISARKQGNLWMVRTIAQGTRIHFREPAAPSP
jgi:hypothetical protein